MSFLYVARELSKSEYGVYVYIGMCLSLLPLLHLGSMHGTVVLLPKKIAGKNNSEVDLFWVYNSFSLCIRALSVFALFFLEGRLKGSIVLMIALGAWLSQYVENTQVLLGAKLEFFKQNLIRVVDEVLRPLLILCFFVMNKSVEALFVASTVTAFLAFLVALCFIRPYFKCLNLATYGAVLQEIYRIGFFIYMIWAIDIVFRTIDRWFIALFYSVEELATYGFVSSLSINVWLLAMSFFAPYSQLLYKYVAEGQYADVKMLIEKTNKRLYVFTGLIAMAALSLYPFLLDFVVKKYFGSEFLFSLLVISFVFLSINCMYVYYMISNNLHFFLLKYQGIILAGNLGLNAIFALFHLNIVFFSYSTIVTLVLYFFLVRRRFYIDILQKIEACNG